MIVRSDNRGIRVLRESWFALGYSTMVVFIASQGLAGYSTLSPSLIGLFIAALGIFLGFRVSEAYDRWWEARRLWGSLVNSSRVFARQVLFLIPSKRLKSPAEAKELIYRHIAYVYALGIGLRFGPAMDGDTERWEVLRPFLSAADFELMTKARNIPTQLNAIQARHLREILEDTPEDAIILTQMSVTLNEHLDQQGGCERIKNTTFPVVVSTISTLFSYMVSTFLPFAAVHSQDHLTLGEFTFLAMVGYSFIMIDRLGKSLKNPFENKPNDTAMTSISRTVEIDLRQMLGEQDLPSPVEAVDGILY